MKTYSAEIDIQASPEHIWSILTNASGYPEWEPNVEKIEGSIEKGNTITVHTKLSPGRAFPVKVSTFEPGEKMVWTGGMPLGLFKGERTFTLEPSGDGVKFSMVEVFSGILLPLFGGSIPDLGPSFIQFAEGLKKQAEEQE